MATETITTEQTEMTESSETARIEKRYVGVKETLTYGVANAGQCIGYTTMIQQRSYFLSAVLGVKPTIVAAWMGIMAFWDAFNDPLMGVIVDKTRTRFGKLRPYLIFVPMVLGVTTIMFFGGPVFLGESASDVSRIIYMCVTYFVWEFFYTIGVYYSFGI